MVKKILCNILSCYIIYLLLELIIEYICRLQFTRGSKNIYFYLDDGKQSVKVVVWPESFEIFPIQIKNGNHLKLFDVKLRKDEGSIKFQGHAVATVHVQTITKVEVNKK